MADNFSKSEKNYGLPTVDLVPIDRDQPGVVKPVAPPPPTRKPKKEKDNRWVPILMLIALGLIIASAVFYFFFLDSRTPNNANNDDTQSQTTDRVTLDEDESSSGTDSPSTNEGSESSESPTSSDNQPVATVLDNQEPGTIQTISDRTGRYYIFLGSYKFKAYAQRHADRLAADGFAVKIITPDNWVGMRVAVGSYTSVAAAASDVSQIEEKYGNQVVVSKY